MNTSIRTAALRWFFLQFIIAAIPTQADELIPEDTCIIEVDAPPSARVSLNGKAFGEKRRFTYDKLEAGKLYEIQMRIDTQGQQTVDRALLIRGGWRVPVVCAREHAISLALQTGLPSITHARFAPDGTKILTSSVLETKVVLWDTKTGIQLREFVGHTGDLGYGVKALAFNATGTRSITGGDFEAILWDVNSGKLLRRIPAANNLAVGFAFAGRILVTVSPRTVALWNASDGKRTHEISHSKEIKQAVLSSSGDVLLTCTEYQKGADIIDVESGKFVCAIQHSSGRVKSAAVSPDGTMAPLGGGSSATLYNARTGELLQQFDLPPDEYVEQVGFSPTATHISTLNSKRQVIIWDRRTGKRELTLNDSTFSSPLEFSHDGKGVFVTSLSSPHSGYHLVDIAHGDILQRFESSVAVPTVVTTSTNSEYLATGDRDGSISIIHLRDGTRLYTKADDSRISSLLFSADSRSLVSGSYSSTVRVWDLSSGEEASVLAVSPKARGITALAADASFDRLVTCPYEDDEPILLWDLRTRSVLHRLRVPANAREARGVAWQEGHLVTGHVSGTLITWNSVTGQQLRQFPGHAGMGSAIAIDPSGEYLLTAAHDHALVLLDPHSGDSVRYLGKYSGLIEDAEFGPDRRLCATASRDRTVRLFNAESGEELRTFTGHSADVHSVSIGSSGRFIISAARDGTTRIWDVATGDELCSILSLNGGQDWLVVTPEGLFDGSEGGMQKVMFRIGDGLNVVPVSRFFQDFYREGLLARIWAGERPMPQVDISQSIPPTVTLVSPERGGETGSATITLEATVQDNEGGVKGPFLRHNGARIDVEPAITRIDEMTARYTYSVNLLERENRLRIEAASGDGAWEAEPAQIAFTYNKSLPKPDLFVLAIGINQYAADALSLSYAVPDVEAVTKVFSDRGGAFYDHVHVTSLTDGEATKSGIRNALREIGENAREQDTLLVYLSGHGFTVGQRYYFIPSEFEFSSPRFEDDVEDQGLPGDQIFRALGETSARKRILVLDTCNSGAALAKSGNTRRDPFAFAGAIRRLSRSEGVFTIAASSASDQTAEIRELGHGVLTYSLLQGVKAVTSKDNTHADGNGDGVVNISEWFGYSAELVPKLTKQYLGVEQDVHQQSEGIVFPVLPLPNN